MVGKIEHLCQARMGTGGISYEFCVDGKRVSVSGADVIGGLRRNLQDVPYEVVGYFNFPGSEKVSEYIKDRNVGKYPRIPEEDWTKVFSLKD